MRVHVVVRVMFFLAIFASSLLPLAASTPGVTPARSSTAIALGTAATVRDWTIQVIKIIPDADSLLQATPPGSPSLPTSGNVFTAVRVSATNDGVVSRDLLTDLSFGVVGHSRVGYTITVDACPEAFVAGNDLDVVAPGESRTLIMCWEVAETDLGTLVMFVIVPGDLPVFHLFALDDASMPPFFDLPGSGASPELHVAAISDLVFTILDVDRDATDRIVGSIEGSRSPGTGTRYVLARISVRNVSDEQVALPGALNYSLITTDGTRIDPASGYCGNIPEPVVQAPMLFAGGQAAFNLCWSVSADTPDDLALEVSFLDTEPQLVTLPLD